MNTNKQRRMEQVRRRIFGPLGKERPKDVRAAKDAFRSTETKEEKDREAVVSDNTENKMEFVSNHRGGSAIASAFPRISSSSSSSAAGVNNERSLARKVSWDGSEEYANHSQGYGKIPSSRKKDARATIQTLNLEAKLSKLATMNIPRGANHHHHHHKPPSSSNQSVASAQPSVESECVRQNAEMFMEMEGEMLGFFVDAKEDAAAADPLEEEEEEDDDLNSNMDDATRNGDGHCDVRAATLVSPSTSFPGSRLQTLAEDEEGLFDEVGGVEDDQISVYGQSQGPNEPVYTAPNAHFNRDTSPLLSTQTEEILQQANSIIKDHHEADEEISVYEDEIPVNRRQGPGSNEDGHAPSTQQLDPINSPLRTVQTKQLLFDRSVMPEGPSEEYEDPSVFGINSLISESSSEMTPALLPAQGVPPQQQTQLQLVANNYKKNKDLSKFLDQVSDQILRGCHDDGDVHSDIFSLNDSQFSSHQGHEVGETSDASQQQQQFGKSQSSDNGNSKNSSSGAFPVLTRAAPLNRAVPLTRAQPLSSENSVDGEDSIFEEEEEDLPQKEPNGAVPLSKSNILPPASTFLSAKDRAKIRQHDTTPLRTNTSRARKMRGASRRMPSLGEASMTSIQEVMEEETEMEDEGDDKTEGTLEKGIASSAVCEHPSSAAKGQIQWKKNNDLAKKSQNADHKFDDSSSALDPPLSSDIDLVKMSYREKHKGHSLSWHSNNGVNGDQLLSRSSSRPHAARMQANKGRQHRLNLLSISARTAMTFQEHFNDDDENKKRGVSPLYRVNAENELGEKENLESINLGLIREGSFEDTDDDRSYQSEKEGGPECRWDGEYTHEKFVRDFKGIISNKKQNAEASPLEKKLANDARDVELNQDEMVLEYPAPLQPSSMTVTNSMKGKEDSSSTNAPNGASSSDVPLRCYKMVREDYTSTIAQQRALFSKNVRACGHQQQSSNTSYKTMVPSGPSHRNPPSKNNMLLHPHDVPREPSKSRLEEKLRGMDKRVGANKRDSASVGSSELGSLLTKESDRSHYFPVPATIFHRTHPNSPNNGAYENSGIMSSRSSVSSMQNTYNNDTTFTSNDISGVEIKNIEVGNNNTTPRTPDDHDACHAIADDIASQVNILLPENSMLQLSPCPGRDQVPTQNNVNNDNSYTPNPVKQGGSEKVDLRAAANAMAKIDENIRTASNKRLNHPESAPLAKPVDDNTQAEDSPKPSKTHFVRGGIGKHSMRGFPIRNNMWKSKHNATTMQTSENNGDLAHAFQKEDSNMSRLQNNVVSSKSMRSNGVISDPPGKRVERTDNATLSSAEQTKMKRPYNIAPIRGKPSAQTATPQQSNNEVALGKDDGKLLRNSNTEEIQKVKNFWNQLEAQNNFGPFDSNKEVPSTVKIKDTNFHHKQLPQSLTTTRTKKATLDDTSSHHSSIFEAFEVAPLQIIADENKDEGGDVRVVFNDFGVHHSYVKQGAKKVGFPETPHMVPLYEESLPDEGQHPKLPNSSAADEDHIGESSFEVMLHPRHLRNKRPPPPRTPRSPPPPPPVSPPPPPASNSNRRVSSALAQHQSIKKDKTINDSHNGKLKQRIKMGWKKMVTSGVTKATPSTTKHNDTAAATQIKPISISTEASRMKKSNINSKGKSSKRFIKADNNGKGKFAQG